jgi:hypothetical protein
MTPGHRVPTVHTVDEYRRATEAAKRLAAQTTDEGERQALLRIAAQWEHLAEYRERKNRQPSS